MMQIESITIKTKQMIDDLKAICANFGLGGSPGEYKIITQVFLYKYLSDKFGYEASKVEPSIAQAENVEAALTAMPDEDYEMMLMMLGGNVAKLKKNHYISYLFNHQNDNSMKKADGTPYPFHELFDDTLVDIANYNLDIFSVQTGSEEKIKLFEPISQYVIETAKKSAFCRAIINKLVEFSFAEVFEQKYDFFSQIFEYLIKDYNKDFGKYAEYYTPHTIADIIARIMVHGEVTNATVYDPAAGSGTLVLALAHQIGEDMPLNQDGFVIYVEKSPAAISVAENEEIPKEISYKLISYNHHSMKGNLQEKKNIILKLAELLEAKRSELSIVDKDFSSDLFYLFNNLNLRHNNIEPSIKGKFKQAIADMSSEKLEHWYDETYQMCLLAFLRLEQADRKMEFNKLKSIIESKR